MRDALRITNLGLRFALELAALGALAYWGAQAVQPTLGRLALAVLAPLAAALLWGAFVSPKAVVRDPVLRAGVEAVVFGAAAVALVLASQPVWGLVLAGLALVSGVLMRVLGE